jgi:two-component system chemotaxis sensor kinase CheA
VQPAVQPTVQPTVQPAVQPAVDCFQGIEDECDGRSKYLGIFIDETELSLDQLTETLMALEGLGGTEATQSLLVIAHRIKGSAASIGLNRVAKLAHLMEDLLQRLVDTGQMLSPSVTDAMLMCSDALRQYVEGLKLGNRPPDQFNHLAQELHAAQESQGQATPRQMSPPTTVSVRDKPAPASRAPLADMTLDSIRQTLKDRGGDQQHTFVGTVQFEPNLPLAGLKGRLLYEKLANLGKVCYFDPPPEDLDEMEDLGGVSFGLVAERPLSAISRPLRIAGVQQAIVEPLLQEEADSSSAAKEPSCEGPTTRRAAPSQEQVVQEQHAPEVAQGGPQAKNRPAESGNKPTETLRVDIERLDQLMNLAGELVISKARFSRISDSLRSVLASRQSSQVLHNALALLDRMASGDGKSSEGRNLQAELDSLRGLARRIQNDLESVRRDVEVLGQVRTTVNDLVETIHQLDRVADGIQQSVMDTRMLPIGPLFTRFKRVIRDITRGNGKSIRLVINGEKTELDKRMIDELGDPLIHMVRNSADHGIELPEVREALGKPREGTVTFEAFHRGNSIIIRVSDDGKGLDSDRIRRKALEKGLVTEADLDKMTRHQIYQLIWEPGLSTAEKVTEVSGRGMGMDIVKSKIEDLNGVVDLESEPGKGTTLTIKLPLTLAILPSLMVEIDGDVFAMPLESVVEIVGVNPRDLATVHGQWTARVRGRVISTVMLGDVFSWTQGKDRARQEDSQETTLVIIGEAGREIGLAVDKVLGEEDVVIKSMAENYRNVAGIAGASILGDGRVSLILDLAALIDMSANGNKPVTAC